MCTSHICVYKYVAIFVYLNFTVGITSNGANPSGTAGHAPSYEDGVCIDEYIEIECPSSP